MNEFSMACCSLLCYRAVQKASDVLTTSWLVEDVSLVSATTMAILATLSLENVTSVFIFSVSACAVLQ